MNQPSNIIIQRVLDESATLAEAKQVAAWFASQDGQKWLADQMERDTEAILDGRIPLLKNIPSDKLFKRIERRIGRKRRRTFAFRIAAVAIPCALILAMWLNLNSRLGGILFTKDNNELVATRNGEQKELVFQDGTKVFLHAGTRITYPKHFGLGERRVELDGEAFFEVAPNAHRAFIVQMGDVSLRVLGTSFNVKAYDSEPTIDIALLDGKVEFVYNEKHCVMSPMQQLNYNKISRQVDLTVSEHVEMDALWHKKIIVFRDASLSEVIADLERWYDVRFEVLDASAYDLRFTLRTPYLPLPELLDEIQHISPIRFDIEDDLIRVRRNC